MSEAALKTQRLFFALWPDDAVRRHLSGSCSRVVEDGGQRRVKPGNLHLTLHFLGNIPLQRIDCFAEQARRVKARPFSLHIDRVGYFGKPGVSWLGCEQLPDELFNLHRLLGERIRSCGYAPEQRPYYPHITCARKVNQAPTEAVIESIQWRVSRFVLVQSNTLPAGVDYSVKASFSLRF